MILTCVVVYNRIENIKRWLHAWHRSKTLNSKIMIIHNVDQPTDEVCGIIDNMPDFYRQRLNVGMDLGAFQEIIKEDAKWDTLCWFTDDLIPMSKDFLCPFIEKMQGNVGLVGGCYEPENASNTNGHVRTVAFSIKKEAARKLKFPADPMLTRQHCFELEHGSNNMTKQILDMGYDLAMAQGNVYPQPGYSHWANCSNWMWDSSLLAHYDLWNKFNEEFGKCTNT